RQVSAPVGDIVFVIPAAQLRTEDHGIDIGEGMLAQHPGFAAEKLLDVRDGIVDKLPAVDGEGAGYVVVVDHVCGRALELAVEVYRRLLAGGLRHNELIDALEGVELRQVR